MKTNDELIWQKEERKFVQGLFCICSEGIIYHIIQFSLWDLKYLIVRILQSFNKKLFTII